MIKMTFEMQVSETSTNLDALAALIQSAAALAEEPTAEEKPAPKKTGRKSKKADAEPKPAPKPEPKPEPTPEPEAEELDDIDEALDEGLTEEELREALRTAARKFKGVQGKAALIAVIRKAGGVTDEGKVSVGAVPVENIPKVLRALQVR